MFEAKTYMSQIKIINQIISKLLTLSYEAKSKQTSALILYF